MVDTAGLVELVPHYVAMILLMFGVLAVVRQGIGDLGFWPELAIALAVVFAYRPIVLRLGVAPSSWE